MGLGRLSQVWSHLEHIKNLDTGSREFPTVFDALMEEREVKEIPETLRASHGISVVQLKNTSLIKYDDNPASTLDYIEQDITLEIRNTNIQLPN